MDELQYGLHKFLARRHGHVSFERVVSGPGLVEVCEYLCSHGGAEGEKTWALLQHSQDAAAEISSAGLARTNSFMSLALDIFCRCYGAHAGNLALIALARGGVFIAGGIAPKIMEKLGDGSFIGAFCAKGRYETFMGTLPVSVVANPDIGLLGARQVAFGLLFKDKNN
jgi:glucokinase